MPPSTVSRAQRITRELAVLAGELLTVTRASIEDRQAVLDAIYQLQAAAMRWLAEGEHS
jgi:hypothetical protein